MSVVWAMRSLISISFVFHSSSFNRGPLSATPGWNFVCATVSPQQCLWNSFKVWLIKALFHPFYASILMAIDCVMFLALCQQVVSQAPQHFRSSEMQAASDGCFPCQSVCSVIPLTLSCPGQYILRGLQRWMLNMVLNITCKEQAGLPLTTWSVQLFSPPRFTWHHLG